MSYFTRFILLSVSSLWILACAPDSYISLSHPSVSTVPAEGGSVSVSIKSNTNWIVGELPHYVSASVTSGSRNTRVTFSVDENITHKTRQFDVQISTANF